jgi:hypothetical protein
MATFDELNALSSKELHDRAFRHAEHHLDLKFFWDLLEEVPMAEMIAGNAREAQTDTLAPSVQVADAVRSKPELMDAMRPIYIDYLQKHPDA